MLVSRTNGWTVDTQQNRLTWGDKSGPLPDASVGALIYFGMGYLESQAAARTVNDHFRKVWLEAKRAEPGQADFKAGDVPASVVPKSDTPEYRARLREAHEDLFDKLLAGYEVGVREGSGDPVEEETDKIARAWLQGVAMQYGWYELPPKRKVARDEDSYKGPKYETFGEALAAFVVSAAPASGKLTGKDAQGRPWPFKIKSGLTVAEAIKTEAERRVAERGEARPSVTLAQGEGDVEF